VTTFRSVLSPPPASQEDKCHFQCCSIGLARHIEGQSRAPAGFLYLAPMPEAAQRVTFLAEVEALKHPS